MSGSGGPEGMNKLQITGAQKMDPATERRQMHLWNQAQQYAGTDPFSAQYGGAAAMPGMGAMSQAGQKYLTNAILGPNQYQAQNLGFTGYQRPESAAAGPGFQYRPDIRTASEWRGGPSSPVDDRLPSGGTGYLPPGGVGGGPRDPGDPEYDEFVDYQNRVPALAPRYLPGGGATVPGGQLAGLRENLPVGDVFPGSPASPITPSALQTQPPIPGGGAGVRSDAPLMATPDRIGLLGQGDVAISPTVGIGEMEMGGLATRRMLEEAAPVTPTYTEITDPTIGTTTVGEVADIGSEVGQATVTGGAGVGSVTPGDVVSPELAGVTGAGVQYITGRDIAGPAGVTIDPVTGQTTEAVGGVAPGEFEAASFLGGPAIADYMNQAGVEAQIAQSEEDYQRQLNALQAQQAGTGAFGARAELEDLGALEAQQRNVAAIRGAGYERAAQRMEADAARRQQAGLQGQQLGVQTGLAGQALEAQRRESDAARAQQAALAGQQIGARAGMQTQQLEQQAVIQGAQNALTAAQANQRAVLQSGTQQQQLEAARQTEEARLGLAAAQQTQRLGVQTGMQTQELAQQADVQNAQNALVASRANLNAAVQSGDRQAQLDAQRQIREAELGVQTAMQTQQLGVQTGMQTQRLGTQVELQNAQNEIRIAEQNMQSALQRGDRQAMIDAQRQQQQAQMGLDAATRNQAAGLQADGMGLDAQGRFRQQQMAGARQLADIGGLTQGATFGAAQQLDRMGAAQEQAQRDQQAWDYQQWLRGQEGGARELALAQSFMPGGMQQQFERRPSRFGQVFGGLLGAGGVARDIYDRFGNRTNQRSSGNNWNDQEGS